MKSERKAICLLILALFLINIFWVGNNYARERGGSIWGRVFKPDGITPLPGAVIKLWEGEILKGSGITKADGRYLISGLERGLYRLEVSARGYVSKIIYGVVVDTLRESRSVDIVLTVTPGSLSGKVTKGEGLAGLPGATVKALSDNLLRGWTVSGPDGTYTISNLEPGIYEVKASASGYLVQTINGVIVATGKDTPHVDITLISTKGSISGKVTKRDKITGIGGAVVKALQDNRLIESAVTKEDGTFTIRDLEAGPYELKTTAVGYLPQLLKDISVYPGRDTNLNPTLEDSSKIRVAVVNFWTANFPLLDVDYGSVISEMFVTALTKVPRFEMIERRQFIKVLEEQLLGSAEFLDQETAKQIGKVLSADLLVVGNASKLGSLVEIDVRLINAETGRVMLAEGGKSDSLSGLREAVNLIVGRMAAHFK